MKVRNKMFKIGGRLALLLLLLTAACSSDNAGLEEGKVNVVTSFYPLYDFAKQIGGEHVHVINLVPAGVDAHDWAPKSRDIVHMTEADLLIYNGLGFEGWLDDFLDSLDPDAKVKPVSATALLEPIVLGEEHEDDHQKEAGDGAEHHDEAEGHAEDHADDHAEGEAEDHADDHAEGEAEDHADDHAEGEAEDHADDHAEAEAHDHAEDHADDHADDHAEVAADDHGHEHEDEAEADSHGHDHDHGSFDPHAWISPLSAKVMAEQIMLSLIEVDPDHTADYQANYEQLADRFDELDQELRAIIEAGSRSDIVVSHHAYGYLERDYGLEQVAVMGISPESEPTPQDMKNIAQYVQEHNVRYILFEELASPRIADILAQEAGVETLVFNPLEGLTEEQEEAGEDFFSVMQRNLTSLEKALQ